MKKYKLLKTYPSLPSSMKVGYEVVFNTEMGLYHHAKTLDRFIVTEIENYPEFWEEVKEKPIILKFERVDRPLYAPAMWYRTEEGTYSPKERGQNGISLNDMLHKGISVDSGDFRIHSVKYGRECFSIGDRVKATINRKHTHTIKAFEITSGYVGGLKVVGEDGLGTSIKYIEKVDKPLFTTENGVDLFEGDDIFILGLNDWLITELVVKEGKFPLKGYSKNKLKYFSTKEAAENYVLINKPSLSMEDIYNEFEGVAEEVETKLLKLIKKKNGLL